MKVLIISLFEYAKNKQEVLVKCEMNMKGYDDFEIYAVKALPNEIDNVLMGKQFDYMYIDVFYDNEDTNKIREHLRGLQYKQIERF